MEVYPSADNFTQGLLVMLVTNITSVILVNYSCNWGKHPIKKKLSECDLHSVIKFVFTKGGSVRYHFVWSCLVLVWTRVIWLRPLRPLTHATVIGKYDMAMIETYQQCIKHQLEEIWPCLVYTSPQVLPAKPWEKIRV